MTDDTHSHNHHHYHDQDDSIEDIGCLQAIEQLYAYLDGELSEEEKIKFEHHMQHCCSCYSRKELETKLSQQLQETAGGDVPDNLQKRLDDLIDKL